MNRETLELIEKLEGMRPVEPASIIATCLGMGHDSLGNIIEQYKVPWGVNAALPGERNLYKIFTQRLIEWLKGEDMKKIYMEAEKPE